MSEMILSSLSEQVLEITINRAASKNALTGSMYATLTDLLRDAQAQNEVNAVLVRGQEGVFSAGNDIHDFITSPPVTTDAPVWQFLGALMDLDKPIIAAVDGMAIGIGTTMLLHCDLVYASNRSTFAVPFTKVGLTPEGLSTVLLPLLVGRPRAMEMLLFGEKITAERALSLGIVNEVVPSEELMKISRQRATTIAALPTEIIRKTKRLVQNGLETILARQFVAERETLGEAVTGPAAQQAFAQFINKSTPK
jgi:enoyl-CoA hydratase/carnithine racemase